VRNFGPAEYIIKKYEGFNNKAYSDPLSDGAWTIGFGTQFYSDGSPVQQGHRITREKADEYLLDELHVIELDLLDLNLRLDDAMVQALVSFIHSVGWSAFLYSNIVDAMDRGDVTAAVEEINKWIFDEDHKAVGGLVERRMEETTLFLSDLDDYFAPRIPNFLLKAFRDYEASAEEVQAIRRLESSISPYVLAEFANSFGLYNRKSFFSEFDVDRIFELPS